MSTDYGSDISCTDDIEATISDIGSARIMPQVVLRRITTKRNTLLSAPDETTIDIRDFMGAGITTGELRRIKAAVTGALIADPRISAVDSSFTFDTQTEILECSLRGNGAGGSFDLTVGVSSLTAEILKS